MCHFYEGYSTCIPLAVFFFFFLNYPPVIKHGNGTYTIVITKTPTTSGCPIANYYPVGQRLQNDLV